MRGPRASKGHHAAQTAASRAHVADIHHLQAYPPKSRPTLAPSLTTTLIYTLGANTRRAARRNGECFHRSRSGRRMRLKLERHTPRHPLSVPFNRDLMGRSWTAMAEADGRDVTLLDLSSRFRYACILQQAEGCKITAMFKCLFRWRRYKFSW